MVVVLGGPEDDEVAADASPEDHLGCILQTKIFKIIYESVRTKCVTQNLMFYNYVGVISHISFCQILNL